MHSTKTHHNRRNAPRKPAHHARRRAQRIAAALVAFVVAAVALPAAAAAAPAGKVNVNTAGAEQLALLPRIGPSTAQRILDYREENGSFEALEDLMLVRGIGEKTFERLEPYVTLEGDTTLAEKVRSPRKRPGDATQNDSPQDDG